MVVHHYCVLLTSQGPLIYVTGRHRGEGMLCMQLIDSRFNFIDEVLYEFSRKHVVPVITFYLYLSIFIYIYQLSFR